MILLQKENFAAISTPRRQELHINCIFKENKKKLLFLRQKNKYKKKELRLWKCKIYSAVDFRSVSWVNWTSKLCGIEWSAFDV